MRRSVLVVLAACYAPKVQSNVPCSEDLHCPGGQTCQQIGGISLCVSGDALPDAPVSMIDAPGDTTPDGTVAIDAAMIDSFVPKDTLADSPVLPIDTDGDGIPDSMDNCPKIANPGQENEDGDRFGDVCDPCPPIADDAPPDTDGDGVADACDPRPTTPGDRIVLFEGFHHGIPATWTAFGGWSASADNAILAASATTALLTVPQALVEPYVVSAGITPTALTTGASPEGIGAVVRMATGGGAGVECVAHVSTNNLTMIDLGSGALQGGQGPLTFVENTPYTIAAGKNPMGYSCALSDNGNYTSGFTPIGVLGTRIGVRANNLAATVAWVMAVDGGG